jgi:hypothetical protein
MSSLFPSSPASYSSQCLPEIKAIANALAKGHTARLEQFSGTRSIMQITQLFRSEMLPACVEPKNLLCVAMEPSNNNNNSNSNNFTPAVLGSTYRQKKIYMQNIY